MGKESKCSKPPSSPTKPRWVPKGSSSVAVEPRHLGVLIHGLHHYLRVRAQLLRAAFGFLSGAKCHPGVLERGFNSWIMIINQLIN